ncbi:hypothetical protein NQ314_018698 [Rhamnusium bicolor]|uniref:DUF4218 domain-containing protein n=1 Tax=Rhamnusium bicolor TaxID=1586634 RepID=A0AAV8WQA0_9CUCU|nr:hypothetical protein NQ314_018698 [Rhamnusium bicolor]
MTFKVKAFICDAPAKSSIKLIKGHIGYFSCSKCTQEGEFINNTICFTEINFTKRTDDDFFLKKQAEHDTSTSILQEIPNIGLVSSFPLDYMHLLCLGVMKKLLVSLWCCGKPPNKLSFHQIDQISNSLTVQSANIPSEFCRKPRTLKEVNRWKATELRQFLLYTGPIVLKSILPKKHYLNFLSLHISIRILCSPISNSDEVLQYAHSLLVYFVETFSLMYGNQFLSHNVHNLLHIANYVKHFGNLDSFSAFPFENYMQTLKKIC